MTTTLEKVARAVCDQYPGKCCKEYMGMDRCESPPPTAWAIARAAIQALIDDLPELNGKAIQAILDEQKETA